MNKIYGMMACAAVMAAAVIGCKDDGGNHTTTETGGDTYFENPINTGIGGNEAVGEIKLDTLCFYNPIKSYRGEFIFRNDSELTSFLDSTMYEKSRKEKEITSAPNFSEYVYFAIVTGPHTITDISNGKDTITVSYKRYMPPPCLEENPALCPDYSPPPPVAAIYFIPYTEKAIVFADKTNEQQANNSAECSSPAADVLDAALISTISTDNAKAWINRVPQSDGDEYDVFDGYILLSSSPTSRVGYWLETTYNADRDCWNTGGIASAGWFVCGNTLKVGINALAANNVVDWGYNIDGTYTVSGDTLTVIQPGKEPQVYTAKTITRCKN